MPSSGLQGAKEVAALALTGRLRGLLVLLEAEAGFAMADVFADFARRRVGPSVRARGR